MKYGRMVAVSVIGLALLVVLGQFGGAQAASVASGSSSQAAQAASQHFSIGTQPNVSSGPGLVVTGTVGVIALGTAGDGGQFHSQATARSGVLGTGWYGGVFTSTVSGSGAAGVVGTGFYGVVGKSDTIGMNTAGVYGSNDGQQGYGVVGVVSSPGSIGTVGAAVANSPSVAGDNRSANGTGVYGYALQGQDSTIGGWFTNYNGGTEAIGLKVTGKGQATGGFSTGGNYSLMVRYHGSTPLHAGDVLALDGHNESFNGGQVLGTVQATAANAEAAVGVVQHRYIVYPLDQTLSSPLGSMSMQDQRTQVDESATTFQAGDLVEVVVVGQATAKVSGNVHIGQRLTIGDNGSMVAAGSGAEVVGKLASKPDAAGMATVLVTLK